MQGMARARPGDGALPVRRALERILSPSRARDWADEAANGLHNRAPFASARQGLQSGQVVAVLAPLVFLVAWGAAWPPLTGVLLILSSAMILALSALRLVAAAVPARPLTAPEVDDSRLPVVTILAPMFREAAVLPQLVRALDRIDYPAEKLDIKLIVEAVDGATLKAARACDLDARFEIVVVPDGAPRTKPRALNYAMRFALGSIVCIYDAEDVPHPGQVRTAAGVFSAAPARLACLQAPLGWYNHDRNWLTRQFALEYAAHFHALLPLLARMGWPLPLGGTSNFFRREALEAVGLWDPYNVTEDADLGFRLATHGYRTGVIAPPTREEAPVRLPAWLVQRSRWIKGYAQTIAVHTRNPQKLFTRTGGTGTLSLGVSLGAAVISAALHAPTVLFFLVAATAAPSWPLCWAACILITGYSAAAICAAVGARRAGLTPRLGDLLTMPAYWPLQTLAACRALWELRSNPYFWAKTEHGHSPAPETETRAAAWNDTEAACPLPSPSSSWAVSRRASALPPGCRDGRSTSRADRA
ncbi:MULTISPECIES: glycosyltransferase family 2 protein [Hyphobacterium]|uniref:Glycosyltransferase family 2 protein n=1 Tax=Hyphobacterium vulgare TaxID=1736751 RepID=A0ABV6ZY40_9PROT